MSRNFHVRKCMFSDAHYLPFLAALLLVVNAELLLADCPMPLPSEITEMLVAEDGKNATLALDRCGALVIAWSQMGVNPHVSTDMLIQYFQPNGEVYNSVPYVVTPDQSFDGHINHVDPSVAMTPLGLARLAWMGSSADSRSIYGQVVLQQDFYYGDAPSQVAMPYLYGFPVIYEQGPSAGQEEGALGRNAWADFTICWEDMHPLGLVEGPDRSSPRTVRSCDCPANPPGTYCRPEWQPCLSMRPSDGYYAVAWAEAETSDPDAKFNIALRVYDPDGDVVDELAGPSETAWVNNPALEDGPEVYTSQVSAAVSFWGDDIVVTWIGPGLYGCEDQGAARIWARRFKFDDLNTPGTPHLRDPVPSLNEGWPGMFTVETDSFNTLSREYAHPTVALWQYDEEGSRYTPWGRFLIAWNTWSSAGGEVRAQYFDSKGQPEGLEFRVNQATEEGAYAQLAKSGQHTIAYAQPGEAAIAFTYKQGSEHLHSNGVYLTILPPEYGQELPAQCCKADLDGDGYRTGLDIQPFVDRLLSNVGPYCLSPAELCPADMNFDGSIDLDDVPLFVVALLLWGPCGAPTFVGLGDCNGNGIPDANDIFNHASADCNNNFVPDECDIDPADTDGNGLVSGDHNSNDIPDECEPDCNKNGVPDDKDIADETSNDINENGTPDECEPDCNHNGIPDAWDIDPNDPDGNEEVSADCNANGVPDECEYDCNANGVPDDCDVDSSDPDGNEEVSEDCNGNGVPDECDLSFAPPRGSLDCNENGIPDECDIANCDNDPACEDCNSNGFPDACDIAAEISLDEDENSIPDECEGESLMFGGFGEEGFGGAGLDGVEDDASARAVRLAAWAEFHEWCAAQAWGPDSETGGAEQFQAMTDKLRELGLPVRDMTIPTSSSAEQ